MSNCTKKVIFPIKVLKTGFVANDKWPKAPGFDLLHHILRFNYQYINKITTFSTILWLKFFFYFLHLHKIFLFGYF